MLHPDQLATSMLSTSCALALWVGSAFAAPITDQELEQRREAFEAKIAELQSQGEQVTDERYAEVLDEAIADLDAADFTLAQIERYAEALAKSRRLSEFIAHLGTLAPRDDVDGARAAVLAIRMTPTTAPQPEVRARLELALNHPALRNALDQGQAMGIYAAMTRFAHAKAAAAIAEDDLAPLVRLVPGEPPTWNSFVSTLALFEVIAELDGAAARDARESLRTKLSAAAQAGLDRALGEENAREASAFERVIQNLNGPFARDALIGSAVPEIDVLWSSDDGLTSFEDLRGRVVVLDFWATWCGPCIASFPKMREEVAHFDGYPVTFVGVTSLQGRHYGPGGKRIDTTDDPELEFELMRELIDQREITWDVVFSKQDVFNPDFGVGITGIPYVAIVDPAGVVRKAGLSPALNEQEIHGTIIELLEEANLPAPSAED